MRNFVSRGRTVVVVLAAVLFTTLTATAAQAAPAGTYAWDNCRDNYSCYFQDADGGTPMWEAPSAGCFDLGRMNPPFNDRISSVWNRGNGAVDMYNWDGSNWEYVDTVQRGRRVSYSSGDWRNDIIDRVCIY